MNLGKYIKDHTYFSVMFFCVFFMNILLLTAFKVNVQLVIALIVIWIFFYISILLIGYYRKKTFYDELLLNLERLDKKFLILETIVPPNFYEGELLCNILYDINKSMLENMKQYEHITNDFKEYIEMWIHEIKIPISSLTLMAHNHHLDNRFLHQLKRVEGYIEQVLYYTRSENAEKDYLIKTNKLSKIIKNIAMKNKDALLEKHIDFIIEDANYSILTDAKWLEFILNQIMNNSIQYMDDEKDENYIKITVNEDKNKIVLSILDNGIGIKESDRKRVFEKSFTGENGRIKKISTGMGLYIAKKLCEKLGHKIEIESKKKEYTKVSITFGKNEFYHVVK